MAVGLFAAARMAGVSGQARVVPVELVVVPVVVEPVVIDVPVLVPLVLVPVVLVLLVPVDVGQALEALLGIEKAYVVRGCPVPLTELERLSVT